MGAHLAAESTALWESSRRQRGRASDERGWAGGRPCNQRRAGAAPGLCQASGWWGRQPAGRGTRRPVLCGQARGPKRSRHRSGSWAGSFGAGQVGERPARCRQCRRGKPGGSLQRRRPRPPGLHFPVSRLLLVGSWSGGISLFYRVGREKGRGHPFSLMLSDTSCRLRSR